MPNQQTHKDFYEKVKDNLLTETSKITFKCNACGQCCFNQDIILSPIDILKLRREIDLKTNDIINKNFITCYKGNTSNLPICVLKFRQMPTGKKICPFLTASDEIKRKFDAIIKSEENIHKQLQKLACDYIDASMNSTIKGKCKIYKNKPEICKLYPLGRISQIDLKTKKVKTQYAISPNHLSCNKSCFKQKEITVKQFLHENEIDIFAKENSVFNDFITEMAEIVIELDTNRKGYYDEYAMLCTLFYNFDIMLSLQLSGFAKKEEYQKIMQALNKELFDELPELDYKLFIDTLKSTATDEQIKKAFYNLLAI